MTPPIAEETQTAEYPAVFQGGGNDLFGILTAPANGRARETGVILTTGGAYMSSPNRNRLSVRLARRLAGDGFHVLRFDYHGVGESTGVIEQYSLRRPFVDDLEGAARWLVGTGPRRIVLVGSCFGARTIMAASDRIDGLAAAVLISAPIGNYDMGDQAPERHAREMSLPQLIRKAARVQTLRNLLAPKNRETYLRSRHVYTRTAVVKARMLFGRFLGGARPSSDGRYGDEISDLFAGPLQWFIARGLPLLMLYGTDESAYRDFERARQGSLRDLFARARAVDVQTIEGEIHGFTTLHAQDAVLASTVAWLQRL